MPAEFLRDVVIQDRKRTRRLSMLPVSIAAHAIAALAVLIIPLAAEVDPPPVARIVPSYMSAMPVPPPPPAPPVHLPAPVEVAAPTRAGDAIEPEIERPRVTVPAGPTAVGGIDPAAGPFAFGPPMIAPVSPPPPPLLPPQIEHRVVRAGGDIKAPRKIVDVAPMYPEIARSAGVGGLVVLEATISEQGVVEQVRVLRSTPLLEAAAIAAVKRWRYTPTLLNGQPVSVLMTVTVNFQLK